MSHPIRVTVHFAGHVQGVGFRYTVCSLAERHPVAGYVQNLADGRVKLVAEGDRAAVEGLVRDVRRRMDRYIREVTSDTGEATGSLGPAGSFEVRYD